MEVAPLSRGFMLMSMFGFIISILMVFPRWQSWGFAFTVVFALMFISSMVSMTYADVDAELAMDHRKR